MFKKILLILIISLYQTSSYSKTNNYEDYNYKYLSDYFSALILSKNFQNKEALKHFNYSKKLLNKHENFLKNYAINLVENGKINLALKEIKKSGSNSSKNFLEAQIISISYNIKKNDFYSAQQNLEDLKKFKDQGAFEQIIYETLKFYTNLFLTGERQNINNNFGKLSQVSKAFQECYLNSGQSALHFKNIVNSEDGDFSRYLFFYLYNLIDRNDFETLKEISKKIDPLNSNLLILQSKIWIENDEFLNFKKYFSCQNPHHILSEFFFLIANLYSSEEQFRKSNFYLAISSYLNPKFNFNNSLLAENYFIIDKFEKSKDALSKLNRDHKIYTWYKYKKNAQIIKIKKSENEALQFIQKKFKEFENPNSKIIYDLANIYKNFGKFEKSIKYYTELLYKLERNSLSYADTLYRRGGSYERIKNFEMSDKDLLNALIISPNDPYILNYLAYSWLERGIKLQTSLEMLTRAHKNNENNAYITDSLGWAYYMLGDYILAEKYINQALQIRPNDPVIMDHYGDILWMLNKKLQAKYYWKNILKNNDFEDLNRNEIKIKVLKGLNRI